MTTRRRLLVLAAALAGLSIAGVISMVVWLAYSQAGLARAVALLDSLDSIQIAIEGERGRLAGPLHVDSLRLRAGRVTLEATGIDLENDLVPILFGRISVRKLAIKVLEIDIGPPVAPPSEQPLRFMPRWLSVGIGQASVGAATIRLPDAGELQYRDVVLSGRVTEGRIVLREAALDAGLWAARGKLMLLAQEPLGLRGELAWSVPGSRTLEGTLKASGDLAKLEVEAAIHDPVVAAASATLEDLASGLHWNASVDSTAFDLSPWIAEPPVGPLSGHLEGHGDLRVFNLAGHFGGPGLPADGLDLDASAALDAGELLLQPVRLATPDQTMTLSTEGGIRLTGERLLDLRSTWTGIAWPLAGPSIVSSRDGTLSLRGWNRLEFSARAAIASPELPDVAVTASGLADVSGITVVQSALQAGQGSAEVAGYLGFDAWRSWRLEATVHDLDLSAFRAGLDSRLSFHAAGSGQGLDRDAAWAAHVGSIEGSLRGQALSGAGFLRHQRDRYDIERFAFRLGPASLEINGHTGRHTDLAARLAAPDLSGFLPELGGSVEASVHARSAGSAVGNASNLKVDLSVRGRDLQYGGQHAAVLSADADIDLSDRDSSWIRVRGAGMQVAGQQVAAIRLSLDGKAREHSVDFQVGAGETAVSLVGAGGYQEGVYRLTATRIESETPALHPYSLEAPMRVVAAADAARLEETCFVHGPRRVCLRADWHRDTGWSAGLSTHDFPLLVEREDRPRHPQYRGVLDLDFAAAGQDDLPWTARARASVRDAWLEFVTPSGRQESVPLGVTHVVLDSLPERHHLVATIDDTQALQLHGEATLDRSPQRSLADSPLSGSLEFSTTRLGLLPLLVPDIDKAEGSLRGNLSVSGVAAAPALGGTLRLDDALFEFYQTNLRLRDVSARVDLLDEGLGLQSKGKAGDGSFQAQGRFAWHDRQLRGHLTLKGDQLLLADIPEIRIEASPDLAFDIDGLDVGVKGTVVVPRARIEPRQLIGAVTTSADEHILQADEATGDVARYRVTSDLRLTAGKAVTLDAFGLKGRLEGSVVIQSRPGEVTTASGELEIKDGKYDAYSKELDVDPGRLLFAGGPVTDPGIDLRASKTVPGYEVGVVARGRLRKPELSLFSVPSMPQSQIASLLLVGRRLDNLDTGSRQSLGGSTGEVVAQGGSILAGQLGRYLGIDEISVETDTNASTSTGTGTGTAAGTGQQASLVIGKFLSPRFYISYGISLSNAINTFKLRYTIGDRWVISGEAGQEASADIEYTIDR